jgi:hypothetical protein
MHPTRFVELVPDERVVEIDESRLMIRFSEARCE